jgi:hypothetical protein
LLELRPFKPLANSDKAALVEEGDLLVRFYYLKAKTYGGRG